MYYVSLGDSYSVGFQPGRGPTLDGYANFVVKEANKFGSHFALRNFGCAGATTTSILDDLGCSVPTIEGAGYYGRTQLAAAEQFMADHVGRIGLITVSIGGNDIIRCAGASNPVTCTAKTIGAIERNVVELASRLRTASGPKVPIIGLTYPDVILGKWVYPPASQPLAESSLVAFRDVLNPILQHAYSLADGTFVDVTAATGAYVPLSRTVFLSPYGTIPYAVAQVCRLTFFCIEGDIHPNTAGYRLIGDLIVRQLRSTH